jgi:hypothetical protein
MPSRSQLASTPEALRPEPSLISGIMGDDTLTPDEKLLMFEALCVHDAAAGPAQDTSAPERAPAPRPESALQRKTHERLRRALRWSALAAALAALILGRARPA